MTIIGGRILGDFDFTDITGNSHHFQVHGLTANACSLKLTAVQDSHFGIQFQTSGTGRDDQILFTGTNSAGLSFDCDFAPPSDGGQVIRVVSGITARTIHVRGTFRLVTTVANTATRFIESEGTATDWHVDCAFRADSSGNTIEEQSPAGKSVSGVFINSKFTLVPTTAEINTTSGSSGNIVDSGVITGGSVGITAPYTDAEARTAVPFVFYIPLGTDIAGAPVTP